MPELPEVETIKRGLAKVIVGKKIADIEIETAKSFLGNKNDVIDTEITGIERRAKLIQIKLSNNLNLLFHLKLTGQLIYRQSTDSLQQTANRKKYISKISNKQLAVSRQPSANFAGGHPSHDWHADLPNSNTRIIFTFNDNSKLFFNDLRKFGWCKVLTSQSIKALKKEFGIEPFSKDFTIPNLQVYAAKFGNRKIKQFLIDQKIIAGIGNIYADESLFEAKISPFRKINTIKLSEWTKLQKSILRILKMAIKYGGTTDSDYVNAEGKKGGMQNHLKVYHRAGQKCFGCNGQVKRITLGGRGTHYCPACQR